LQNGLTLASGSTVNVVAADMAVSSLAITGGVDLTGGSRTLNILNDGSLVAGQPYTYSFATMTSTTGFTASSFTVAAGNFPGFFGTPIVTNPGGMALLVSFTPVPEPVHALLFGMIAVGGLSVMRRRRPAETEQK
jgi:hypothetical protein